MRILHAEDESDIRESLARQWKRKGHVVTSASDGQKAWDLLCKMEMLPDIIVSDCGMPRMMGDKLLLKVRADPRFSGIPFIIFSGSSVTFDGEPLADLCANNGARFFSKKAWNGDAEKLLEFP